MQLILLPHTKVHDAVYEMGRKEVSMADAQ